MELLWNQMIFENIDMDTLFLFFVALKLNFKTKFQSFPSDYVNQN